jgi:hypothetical protein
MDKREILPRETIEALIKENTRYLESETRFVLRELKVLAAQRSTDDKL